MLRKIDRLYTITERRNWFSPFWDRDFKKNVFLKLLGITVGLEVSNKAEYGCPLSLNNFALMSDKTTTGIKPIDPSTLGENDDKENK